MAYGRSRTTRPERVRQTRNTARRGGANMPFQGGLAPNQGPQRRPGQGPQQNQARCPVGQKPGMGPGGRMTCVPDTGQGQGPGAPNVRPAGNRGRGGPKY